MPPPQLTVQTLAVLSRMTEDPDAEWYGLKLSEDSGLKPGTIYPILDRLLKAKWVERWWEEIDPVVEGRPRRRLYRLTGTGASEARMALDQHLASLGSQRPVTRTRSKPGLGTA